MHHRGGNDAHARWIVPNSFDELLLLKARLSERLRMHQHVLASTITQSLFDLDLVGSWHHDVPLIIVFRLEERIAQCNQIDLSHSRIIANVRVNEEEYRHIDRFSSIQFLFIEAETLNFGEIRRCDIGCDIVRRDADDVFFTQIGGGVESKRRFAGKNSDLPLLRRELPLQ